LLKNISMDEDKQKIHWYSRRSGWYKRILCREIKNW